MSVLGVSVECFVPHLNVCVLFSNLEQGTKCSELHGFVWCAGAYVSALTYTVYLAACLSVCQIHFFLFHFLRVLELRCVQEDSLVGICSLRFVQTLHKL